MTASFATVPQVTPEFVGPRGAEQFSGLSYHTLKRRHRGGADTGLRKNGRRVLFHIETLRRFIAGEVAAQPSQVQTAHV